MSLATEQPALAPSAQARTAAAALRQGARAKAVMSREFLHVQEIRSFDKPTRIANAPHFIKGVLNLRGVIVPVADLRLKFGCDTAEYTAATVIIVLNVRGRVIGAVVDAVSDVIALDADSIKPAPEMGASVDAAYIMGIGCAKAGDQERMLVLTDIEALMASPDMALMDPTTH
jgi:purine-binding chemotaxis protein CheW